MSNLKSELLRCMAASLPDASWEKLCPRLEKATVTEPEVAPQSSVLEKLEDIARRVAALESAAKPIGRYRAYCARCARAIVHSDGMIRSMFACACPLCGCTSIDFRWEAAR